MTRGRLVAPFRWVEYGIDVRTITDHPTAPLFFAEDVCRALDIPVPFERDNVTGWLTYNYPGAIATLDDIRNPDGAPRDLYTRHEATRVANNHPEFFTAAFLEFIDTVTDAVRNPPPANPYEIPADPAASELVDGITYTVSRAATILSRDPSLFYGRDALFETMRKQLDWIHREEGIWVPKQAPLNAGYLVRHRVPVRPGRHRIIYPQIRITREGLDELHTRLGGTATLNVELETALTLLES